MNANYEIGGLCCEMSRQQAEDWNRGNLTDTSLTGATIHLPGPVSDGNGVVFDLWDFIENIHPEIYESQMVGMPANPIAAASV